MSQIEFDRVIKLIDSNAFKHNVEQIQQLTNCKIIFMLKDDAYHHDSIICAKLANKNNIYDFGVATLQEAIALRKARIKGRIQIYGQCSPSYINDYLMYQLIPTIISSNSAKQWSKIDTSIDVSIAIDTGIHRFGIESTDTNTFTELIQNTNLHIVHIYSHLGDSERYTEESINYTHQQINRFDNAVAYFKNHLPYSFMTSLQASYGLLNYPNLNYDAIRLGVALLGYQYIQTQLKLNLQPIATLLSRVIRIQSVSSDDCFSYSQSAHLSCNSRIATLSIGYGDGLMRHCIGWKVYINNYACEIIGKISMDCCLVNIHDYPIKENDIAIIFDSNHPLIPQCLALHIDFLEMITKFDKRVPTIVFNGVKETINMV